MGYPSDLKDKEWKRIEGYFQPSGVGGRKPRHSKQQQLGLACHISTKIEDTFAVLPKRWIVERTFAWLGNFRRLAKDVEILTGTAENMIRIAMLKITLAKLR